MILLMYLINYYIIVNKGVINYLNIYFTTITDVDSSEYQGQIFSAIQNLSIEEDIALEAGESVTKTVLKHDFKIASSNNLYSVHQLT